MCKYLHHLGCLITLHVRVFVYLYTSLASHTASALPLLEVASVVIVVLLEESLRDMSRISINGSLLFFTECLSAVGVLLCVVCLYCAYFGLLIYVGYECCCDMVEVCRGPWLKLLAMDIPFFFLFLYTVYMYMLRDQFL